MRFLLKLTCLTAQHSENALWFPDVGYAKKSRRAAILSVAVFEDIIAQDKVPNTVCGRLHLVSIQFVEEERADLKTAAMDENERSAISDCVQCAPCLSASFGWRQKDVDSNGPERHGEYYQGPNAPNDKARGAKADDGAPERSKEISLPRIGGMPCWNGLPGPMNPLIRVQLRV